MCGIYGWSFGRKPRITPGQREVLASVLAVANATRGRESWGFYGRSGDKSVVHREVGSIAGASGLGAHGMWGTFMAHTRQSTQGKVTRENCHPFQVGNLLLAHNGVIFNHEDLNKELGRTCKVDSIHLAKHLAENRSFKEIHGYGSIEWIDIRKPLAVFLCRMRNGSLSVAGIKSRGRKVGVVWSSDHNHLESALEAAHLNWYIYEECAEGQVYQANRGKFYKLTSHKTLTLGEPAWSLSERDEFALLTSGYYTGRGAWEEKGSVGRYKGSGLERTIYTNTGFYVSKGDDMWYKDSDDRWRAHRLSPSGRWVPVERKSDGTYHEVDLPGYASELTTVDAGLYADNEGRIHDTEDGQERCSMCLLAMPVDELDDNGMCDECGEDSSAEEKLRNKPLHSMTAEEWNQLGKDDAP